ncbi:MAG: hypothetical protein KGJ23_08055 [Euryarchaeota archaeon]|nr:hypothetical protein [Euryarchaeota archaeon]MDE1836554.1 hypothetical protein [Euryarchaeota archaeon]MDE1879251.1 hypothetical protein [Euryarchaeota archaeon]MDE2044524.1 hypothetical protein [Thermoplasmata archaeon]
MGDTFYVWVNVQETKRPAAVLTAIRRVMDWTGEGNRTRRAPYGFCCDKMSVGARGEHDLFAGTTPKERHAQLVEAVRKADPAAKVGTSWLDLDSANTDYEYGADDEDEEGS